MPTTMKTLRVLGSAFISLWVVVGSVFFLQLGLPSGATAVSAALLIPSPTPLPTSTPPVGGAPQANLDLKSELFLWAGGGVPSACDTAQLQLSQLPMVSVAGSLDYGFSLNSGRALCIYGIPAQNGDLLTATLYDTAGYQVASGTFVIDKVHPTVGKVLTNDTGHRHVGYTSRVNSIFGADNSPLMDLIEIRFRALPKLPATGYWVVDWRGQHIKSDVQQIWRDGPGLVIQPQTDNLFGESPCPSRAPGEVVPILGIDFPPDTIVPFGLYRYLPTDSNGFTTKVTLVSSQFLRSDGAGIIDANIQITPTAPPGLYFLLAVLDPTSDTENVATSSCRWAVAPSLAFQPPPPPGAETFFFESFEGSNLDRNIWRLYDVPNSVSVYGSILRLANFGSRFPFLYNQELAFPQYGDFRVQSLFRYSKVDTCGVGIIIASYAPSAGLSQSESGAEQQAQEQEGVAVGVWQDRSGLQVWFRSGAERREVNLGGPDTNLHNLTIDYTANRYRVYLDDHLTLTSAPTPYQPSRIWMGNPVDLGAGFACPWDTLEVDQLQVERITTSSALAAPATPPAAFLCSIPVGNSFTGLWQRADVSNRLGCPIGGVYNNFSAEEGFQHGAMLWRQNNGAIYAIYNDGKWDSFADTFVTGSDPDYACGAAASPPSPRRGFSKVWCNHETVRTKLGFAIEPEIGYCIQGGRPCEEFQDFAGGFMFYSRRTNSATVLFNDGSWLR